MVAADKIDRGLFDQRPNLGGLQVLDFILVGGSQMCAHGAIMVCENDAATAGWNRWVEEVFDADTGFDAGFAKNVGVFVRANATDEEDGGRG